MCRPAQLVFSCCLLKLVPSPDVLNTFRFSHPVAVLPRAAVSLNDIAATILSINSTGPRGALCSDFAIRAMVGLPICDAHHVVSIPHMVIDFCSVSVCSMTTWHSCGVCRCLSHRGRRARPPSASASEATPWQTLTATPSPTPPSARLPTTGAVCIQGAGDCLASLAAADELPDHRAQMQH